MDWLNLNKPFSMSKDQTKDLLKFLEPLTRRQKTLFYG